MLRIVNCGDGIITISFMIDLTVRAFLGGVLTTMKNIVYPKIVIFKILWEIR